MIFSGTSISKFFGDRQLFGGVSFSIEKGEKIGFVGANGVGKTTLFEMICGSILPSSGGFSKPPEVKIGYLKQQLMPSMEKSAYEEAVSVFSEIKQVQDEIAQINDQLMLSHAPELLERQHFLSEKAQQMGALTYESRTIAALKGIGFSQEEIHLPISALSGGQRSKVGLVKLLLASPDLMLLDEPTNHLDIDSLEWLEEYIVASKSAAIIISHDRYFLDSVTNRTFELENGKFYESKGNLSNYLELKAMRRESELKKYENTMREVARIEGIIKQQKQFNREKNIKTAESKQKQINRMLKDLKEPDKEISGIKFGIESNNETGFDVLKVNGISAVFDGKVLFENAEFEIKKGENIFLIGPNGCGKTTLINKIAAGDFGINFGSRVNVGYFSQHGDTLCLDKTIFEQFRDDFPMISDTEIRNALAAFFFFGDDVFKNINKLSGGEKARVAICELILQKPNLLILDEPTNHLDIYSATALTSALSSFQGSILAVSHDRHLINMMADRLLVFSDRRLESFFGNYNDYAAMRKIGKQEQKSQLKEMGDGGKKYHEDKKTAAELRRLKTAATKQEDEITRLEASVAELTNVLQTPSVASDYKRAMDLSAEILAMNDEMEKLIEHWESLTHQILLKGCDEQ